MERFDAELRDDPIFSPIEERDDCPLCMTILPLARADSVFMSCCGKWACSACAIVQNVHKSLSVETTFMEMATL